MITPFQNCHEGERAFVLGNGKSIAKTDLTKLENEVTFGSNRIYLSGFLPKYHAVVDWLVMRDNHHDLQHLTDTTRFLDAKWRDLFRQDNNLYWINIDPEYIDRPGQLPRFSAQANQRIFGGGTVTYILLQLAYWMGCDPVYVIGCDHDYIIPAHATYTDGTHTIYMSHGDDPNHFHPDYFGAGRRFHDPKPERMYLAYQAAKQAFEADGRKIYNAGYDSKLNVFERVNYEELFNA